MCGCVFMLLSTVVPGVESLTLVVASKNVLAMTMSRCERNFDLSWVPGAIEEAGVRAAAACRERDAGGRAQGTAAPALRPRCRSAALATSRRSARALGVVTGPPG